MVLIHKYGHTHTHTTDTHSQTALFKCSPDSMWSSDRTVLPPLVVRSCLKDQSGEVIQTERERGSLSFMTLLSPGQKNVVFFQFHLNWCYWQMLLTSSLASFFFFLPSLQFFPHCTLLCFIFSISVCLFPPSCTCTFLLGFRKHRFVNFIHFIISLTLFPMQCAPSYFFCAFAVLPPRLPLSRFLCLCLTAGVFLKNNKVWGCACACVLRWLHRLDGLAALGWLLVWSPGKLYDLFS